MNGLELYKAINEIDIELIEEANKIEKKEKIIVNYPKIMKIFIGAAAAVAVVIGGTLYGNKIFSNTVENVTGESNVVGTTSKEYFTTSVNNNEATTERKTTGVLPSTAHTLGDYSSHTLAMWLSDPNVVWGTYGHKGEQTIESTTPLGTVKIEDSLKNLMRDKSSSTIYAVFVDYSSCIDEQDFWNWNYNGTTAANLLNQLRTVKEDDPGYNAACIEYNTRFMEIQSAYCKMKTDSFKNTFKKAGLEVYYVNKEGVNTGAYYFYTFATKAQIYALSCNDTEAFVLTPADQLK